MKHTTLHPLAQNEFRENRLLYVNENTSAPENENIPAAAINQAENLRGWDLPQNIARWFGRRIKSAFNFTFLDTPKNVVAAADVVPHMAGNIIEGARKDIAATGVLAKMMLKTSWDSATFIPKEAIHTVKTGVGGVYNGMRNRFSEWGKSLTGKDWKVPFRFAKETGITLLSGAGILPGAWTAGKNIVLGDPNAKDKYKDNILQRNWNTLNKDVRGVATTARDWVTQWAWKTPLEHGAKPLVASAAHLGMVGKHELASAVRVGVNPVTVVTPYPENLSYAIQGNVDSTDPGYPTVTPFNELFEKEAANDNQYDVDQKEYQQFMQWKAMQQGRTGTEG